MEHVQTIPVLQGCGLWSDGIIAVDVHPSLCVYLRQH